MSWPSSNVVPSDYDAMLYDVANHMSRSELLRRISTHSTSTSGSSRKGSTRISKQTSASNSPNYVQRRRTTANHTTRSYPKASQDSAYQTREQRLRTSYNSSQPQGYPRPMSWHPRSTSSQISGAQMSMNEPALGNTIANLENLAVSGTPSSSVQRSIQNAFAMGYGYPTGATSTMYETSPANLQCYGALGPGLESSHDPFPIYSVSDQAQCAYMPQGFSDDVFTSADYQPAQQWPQDTSYLTMTSQAPQALSAYPTAIAPKMKASSAPRLSRRKSKELVGMGLYDDRESSSMSLLDIAASQDSNRDSMGKGLKLEETWQPPNDDDEEEEDEGYSTEEADEAEEAPQPVIPSAPAEVQPACYPAYRDMSNQSFFFNDDDEYINEDQYASYLAYAQAFPGGQSKPQFNPQTESYLWF